MNDLIDRQAAIDSLNDEYHGMISDESMKIYQIVEWLNTLPSAQPNLQPTCNQLATDCISRQAAIDFIGGMNMCDEISDEAYKELTNYLDELTSAQAEKILVANVTLTDEQVREAVEKAKNSVLTVIESERKKGKWIKHEVKGFDGRHTGRFFDECSECGKLTTEWRKVTEYHGWNFCPNCGAEMEVE